MCVDLLEMLLIFTRGAVYEMANVLGECPFEKTAKLTVREWEC